MSRIVRASLRLRSVLPLLTFLPALGCDGPSGSSSQSDRLPLSSLTLPSLSCSPKAVQAGECQRDEDCGQGELCTLDERVQLEDRVALPLRCGMPLGTGAVRDRCERGGDCESGLCALAGVCLSPCGSGADCQPGQSCMPVEAHAGEGQLSPVQACARVSAFRDDVQLSLSTPQQLLEKRLNRVPVALKEDNALLFLLAGCGRSLRVQRIVESASQRVLFDVAALLDGQIQLNPALNEGAVLPVLMPETPSLSLVTSGYELGVTIDQTSDVQLLTAQGNGVHRLLDLNVFYVGGGETLKSGGLHPGDGDFREVLGRLTQRFAAIEIELGSVREYDVVGALRTELSDLTVRNGSDPTGHFTGQVVEQLDRLFELSAGVDDGGLNLFVVSTMGPVLGISGGVPGALGLHGTSASGVAIALDSVGIADSDRVLFHELSHQLGLFHTSESDGFVLEPLSDTAICSAEQDLDQDGILDSSECAEHGADNLMFWEGTGDELSPQQIELLQRSLVLR